jgi:N6-L-threonylcarbamoyladenine synthase
MTILAIETSCDETAVSILDCHGPTQFPKFKALGNALYSQVKLHRKYGGVYPNLAKREHAKNLIPLLEEVLKEAKFFKPTKSSKKPTAKIEKILEREPELLKNLLKLVTKIEKPPIDAIAVTFGPGLEPTLWVGVNFAEALGVIWNLPVIPVNHMEGHFVSVLYNSKLRTPVRYPAIALLISGGHTQLVLSEKPLKYKIIGETRDDAVGEAYDKVARMLSLPYPGGPQIYKLAQEMRSKRAESKYLLPRPMLNSDNFDFSFSGLKTAVLYTLRKEKKITSTIKKHIARAFEDAVTDVLIEKTRKAVEKFRPKSLIVAGGVIANEEICRAFESLAKKTGVKLYIPEKKLSTDNSIMIAMAGYIHIKNKPSLLRSPRNRKMRIMASGNAELH